jgi:hypothetical protein
VLAAEAQTPSFSAFPCVHLFPGKRLPTMALNVD